MVWGGQGAELRVTEHPPLTSCPSPVSHAGGDACICPPCSLKAMPGPVLPVAGARHPRPPGPLRRWRGACGFVGERSLHGQAPRRGRFLGGVGSLPVPNACLHEASANRSPFFFCCHLTSLFLPRKWGGSFHKLRFLVKLLPRCVYTVLFVILFAP